MLFLKCYIEVLIFFLYKYFVIVGPKLFKEPSSKSNKPIIHNAISHCCLAGKVNEPQKNSILEVCDQFGGSWRANNIVMLPINFDNEL